MKCYMLTQFLLPAPIRKRSERMYLHAEETTDDTDVDIDDAIDEALEADIDADEAAEANEEANDELPALEAEDAADDKEEADDEAAVALDIAEERTLVADETTEETELVTLATWAWLRDAAKSTQIRYRCNRAIVSNKIVRLGRLNTVRRGSEKRSSVR